jgi:urea ABC transporter ATP-binding protein UrtE
MSLLEATGFRVGYGAQAIVHGVDLVVEPNELVCVLGRNGVGKSTLLKGLMGLVTRQGGTVRFAGADITRERPYRIARRGIGYVPQGRELFGPLTVEDNLRLGGMAATGRLQTPPDEIYDYFPILKERREQRAGTLSGGEQQMLAIARVLASRPKLMLCDEPSEGLQPSVIDAVATALETAAKEMGLAVLLVEQNMRLAAQVTTRGYVIAGGRVVHQGPIAEVTSDDILHRYIAFTKLADDGGA